MSKPATVAALAVLLPCLSLHAGEVVSFDPPDTWTFTVQAIDEKGDVAGLNTQPDLTRKVYIRASAGKFKILASNDNAMEVEAMNDHELAAGWLYDGTVEAGFVVDKHKHLTKFRPADQASNGYVPYPTSVNDKGTVVGIYGSDHCACGRGFLRDPDGQLISFDAPGAGQTNQNGTFPQAINMRGTIVGYLMDDEGQDHGFVRKPGGGFTVFDVSGAFNTQPLYVNDGGLVAGKYIDNDGIYHGFLRAPDGKITPFDVPGGAIEDIKGLTADGTVADNYQETTGRNRGFLRDPGGKIIAVDATKDARSTSLQAVNDQGWVAGLYTDGNFNAHGFIWKPRH